jgi:hypothetical protein
MKAPQHARFGIPSYRKNVLALLLLAVPALAQRPKADPRLAPLTFLSGHWTSTTEEEYWSSPIGESMVGTYRVLKEEAPVFYEFWAIEIENGEPVYKMKHFNANLQGWEPKDESVRLPMTEHETNSVTFSNGKITLHYERHGAMLFSTLTRIKNGKEVKDEFRLRRTN